MFSLNKRQRYQIFWFVLLVVILVLLGFWRSLDFYFWRDDWDLWSQQHYFWQILRVHSHPGTWVTRALLFNILGWEREAWQALGLVLRILSSLTVSLLVLQISKSKRIAFLTGIFLSTSVYGLETVTWASVYIIPMVTILASLSFYFWVLLVEKKLLRYGAISLACLFLAIAGDPGRVVFVTPVIALWELLNWRIQEKREKWFYPLFRIAFLITAIVLFTKTFLSLIFISQPVLIDNLKYIVRDTESFGTFFASIGNLLPQQLVLNINGHITAFMLLTVTILLLTGLHSCYFKKSRFGLSIVIFTFWIPITYIPNWLANKSNIAAMNDHYLAVSSIGFLVLLALFVSKIKIKFFLYLVTLLIVANNIKLANQTLVTEESFRSSKIIEPYFDQIEREVPQGEQNSIFMYLGNDNAKYVDLDWSNSNPFGVKRGLTRYEDFPIVTADEKLILKLLCEDHVYRPSNMYWTYQEKRIPLSHLHAWELNGGILKNVSIEQRDKFRKKALENNCNLEE